MHILKYNKYTHRYYKYNLEDVDISSSMFDENIHDNDIDFEKPMPKTRCMYCNTIFKTRSDLFYHLGFMNIDIGRQRRRKRTKRRGKYEYYLIKRSRYAFFNYRKKKNDMNELENMMQKKLKI